LSSLHLNIILLVITSPNSAFAEIRDNENKYFRQSIAIFVIVTLVRILGYLPFLLNPINVDYEESYLTEFDNFELFVDPDETALSMVFGAISGIIFIIVFFYIGKILGGNTDYRKVFSVMFYSLIPSIPFIAIVSVVLFFMVSSLAEIPLEEATMFEDDKVIMQLLVPFLTYIGILVVTVLAFLPWWIIVTIKAAKTVNGFGAGKAIGVLLLALIVSTVVTIPLGA